jgi:hypothetical protein
VIAFSRPFLPLFLHVLGAMLLFGSMLTATITSFSAWRRPEIAILRNVTFWSLVAVAVPAWVITRVFAQVILSKEDDVYDDPTWVGIGFLATEPGLLLLLGAIGTAFWWRRSSKPVAGRVVAVLSALYLVLLCIAWLAMSGKWGS